MRDKETPLDADYQVHWTGETDFYITREDPENEARETFVFARDRLNYTLNFSAHSFKMRKGIDLSAGYRLGNDEFLKRVNPQGDAVDWFVEGEPVEYEDGKPMVASRLQGVYIVHTQAFARRNFDLTGEINCFENSFGALGLAKKPVKKGTILIQLRDTPGPTRFYVGNGPDFAIEMQLRPADYAEIVSGLSEGQRLNVSLSDFAFVPLLVTEDGERGLKRFYWLPHTGPFKDIYSQLEEKAGDSFKRQPSASIGFFPFAVPEAGRTEPRVPEVTSESSQPAGAESGYVAIGEQISGVLARQENLLLSLRRILWLGNLLLLALVIVLLLR